MASIGETEAAFLYEPVRWPARKCRAGPEFFATNTVSNLGGWSRNDLARLGILLFPMAYDRALDRYHATEWSAALAEIGNALSVAGKITLIGHQGHSNELESLHAILSRCVVSPIEMIQCWDDRSPGQVWRGTVNEAADTPAERAVVIIVGKCPLPSVLGVENVDLLVCLCNEVTPSMFEIRNRALALPVSPNGWKLPHVAMLRLFDFEAEQATSSDLYGEMFNGAHGLARPLCSIASEVWRYLRTALETRRPARPLLMSRHSPRQALAQRIDDR